MYLTEINLKLGSYRMRKNFQCAQFFQIMAFLSLFVLVYVSEINVEALNEPKVIETVAIQNQITGEWSADFGKSRNKKHGDEEDDEAKAANQEDKLYLQLKRRTENGTSNSGSTYQLTDFQGLTREQVSGNSNVSFSLQREAGTFQFEGSFNNGKGAGRFALTPNASFLNAMNSRGYALSEEKQFASAMLDVRVKTVDDLKAAGLGNLSLEDVFKATIFKINPEFISEMRSIGYENLAMEDFVKARIFKISAQYVREVQAAGFDKQPMESLVKMRIFKVTPEFLREIQAEGLTNLDVEHLVKLRIFKIDGNFIRQARAGGNKIDDVEDLVRLKIHGRVK
jgi:hypothetical protein